MSTAAGDGSRAAGTARSPLPASDGDEDEAGTQARSRGQQVREAAHRYLEDGLLPVPAWAARPDGGCCCPRGAGCGRPGKHPRSVRSGPGPRDYSWKPLACRTHAEIDRRFADDGPYAAGNLMAAIPDGMMAIDVDDDDGGRAAVAGLAEVLGDLPPTLSHRTPHGGHLIYRTPPGWKGRAWVGKDPANPLPPGIDLRMPGQILMAAPSLVPGPDRPARYGPLTGDHVAALPGSYVTAWTPPQPRPRPAGRRVPVPPGSAGRAARYVHEAMTRIAGDLASHQPGGRNAAAYAAGLKAGSLLGAARATPGAEHAAWTDEQAEEALMDAAERNGYTGKDGPAEARRAIRSGLRNGLRSPRALPDFTAGPPPGQRQPSRRAAPIRPRPGRAADGRKASRWQDILPEDIRRQVEDADRAASDRRRAAITAHQRALEQHSQAATAATAAEVQRTRAAAHAAHEAYTRDGRHVTGRHDAAMLRWAAGIADQRDRRSQHAGQSAPAAEDTARVQANRAAAAANDAYKAGDLDRAEELTQQAAALDPSRAGLWQQHRNDITARRLITSARAAHADGDHERAGKLLQDARKLDPRLRTLWDGGLPVQPATQPGRSGPGPGSTDPETHGTGGTGPAHPGERAPQGAWPFPAIQQVPDRAVTAAPRPAGPQPGVQRPARGAGPREPRTAAPASAQDPDADAGDDAARWPSPGRRSQPQATARPPAADRGARTVPQAPAGGARHPSPAGAGAGSPTDWRDEILTEARRPWRPGPSWPDHPAIHRTPETAAPEPGIEPGR